MANNIAQIDLTTQVKNILAVVHGGTGQDTPLDFQEIVQSAILFADAEVPSGTQNSSNVTFYLAHAPNPAKSLILSQNGLVRKQGSHYTLSANVLTWASAPASSDDIQGWYRYLPTIAEEEFWTNAVAAICQTYRPFYQWLGEMYEDAHGLHGVVDEDYWMNRVAPVPSTNKTLQQWPFEMHEPAGHLHNPVEEEYGQNPVAPRYQMFQLFYQWLCEMNDQAHGLYAEDEDYNWTPTVTTQPWLYPQPFNFDSSQQDLG